MSKKDGTFTKEVSLPESPVHGKAYTVSATLKSDAAVSTSDSVTYDKGAPILTKFDLYYYGHDLKYLNLLNAEMKANSIWPSKPLKFVVHFDNYEDIANVFVTSTKNGITSRMQAYATETPGEYIAEGFFDKTNSSYVPGTINVLYDTKTTVENYTKEITKDDLPDAWKNSTVDVISDDNSDYRANITI